MLPLSPGPKMDLLGVQTLGGRHRGRHFISVIKSLAPWATKPFPGPLGSQKYMYFPCPNSLLIELAYLYFTQKNPKVIQQQGDIEPISSWAFCWGGALVINLLPFTSSGIDSEETREEEMHAFQTT